MKLTEHFSLEEMIKSQTGARKGIDNTPPPEVIENLKALCENVLEKIRIHFGRPVTVNSGYRGTKLNKAAGRWATNAGGEYFAIGVGGAVTGKGADLLIIDDPHSEKYRDWETDRKSTRLNSSH